MIIKTLEIPARDGYALAATLYEPPRTDNNGYAVLINSATGVKRRYYGKYAEFLCKNGFVVLTYDYRGIGDSLAGRLRDQGGMMREWGEKDMAGMIAWLRGHYPQRKLLAIGHSVGGQVFGLCDNNHQVAGMLLVGSQSGSLWKFHAPYKYGMFVLMYLLIPVVSRLVGYFPASKFGLGEDLPDGVAREWARWCRSPDYCYGDKRLSSRENFHGYRSPILAYAFSDDHFAPRRATEALLNFYRNAPSQIEYVRPSDVGVPAIGHFGFFRDTFRDSLWPATAEWLRQH